jgi:hypothetical protein
MNDRFKTIPVRVLADVPSKHVQSPVYAGEIGQMLLNPPYEWTSILAPERTAVVLFDDGRRCIIDHSKLEKVLP